MARRGENIYYRKDGRWEGRCITGRKLDGKPKFRSVYGTNYSEVKKKLVLLKSQHLDAGKQAVVIYGNGSLSDWMDYWLDVAEKPYVRETTYLLYKRNIENHLKPKLGSLLLKELTMEQIQRTADSLRESLAPSTLHGVCRLLKSILLSAVKHRLLYESPYREIRLPKFRQRAPRVLNRAEQVRLERVAVEEGALECLVDLYTGLRLGELCAIQYGKIDFENSMLRVDCSVKRVAAPAGSVTETRLVVGKTKSESSTREIPIPFFLSKMLENRMKETGARDSGYLFQNSRGGPANPRSMQKRLKRLFRKAGIRGAHMHTLRHTFAMRFLEQNPGAYKALSEILGHSSSAITIKCYDNCTMERKQQSMHQAKMIA